MAAPSLSRAGTGVQFASGNSNVSVTGVTVGDLVIIHAVQDGAGSSISCSAVSGIENLAGSAGVTALALTQPLGSSGSPSAHHHLWVGRATSSTPTVNISTPGDDVYAVMFSFSGVNDGTALSDILENGSAGSTANGSATSNTIADVGVTTLGPDRLALQFVAVNDDNAVDSFTGESGGDWQELASEFASSTGTDACIELQGATMASAGTIDGGTYTMAASDSWGVIGFALKPVPPPSWEQKSYRFRNDDGSETTATWKAAADTGVTAAAGDKLRLRVLVQDDGAGAGNLAVQMQYQIDGGGWNYIGGAGSTIVDVRAVDSPNLTDDSATTQQLGAGTFVAGWVEDSTSAAGNALPIAVPSGDETEFEYSLELNNSLGGLVTDAVVELRLIESPSTPFATYTHVPTITIGTGALSLDAGKVSSGQAVRGADVAPSGSASLAAGKIASSAAIRGVALVGELATLSAGKVASTAAVRGADLAPETATLSAGKVAPSAAVRGADVTPSGAATLAADNVPSSSVVRGADLTPETATLAADKVPSSSVVRGADLQTPQILSVGHVASSELVHGADLVADTATLSAGVVPSVGTVRGADLAPDTATLPAGHVASGAVVRGADVQAGATHLQAGKVASAAATRGADVSASGAAPASAGKIASAEQVRGADLAGVTTTLAAGAVPSGELVRGADIAAGGTTVHAGKVTSTAAVRGANTTPAGAATLGAGKASSAETVRGVTLQAGTATLLVGKFASTSTVRGVTLQQGQGVIAAGKVTSGAAVRGVTLAGELATLAPAKLGSTAVVYGAGLSHFGVFGVATLSDRALYVLTLTDEATADLTLAEAAADVELVDTATASLQLADEATGSVALSERPL